MVQETAVQREISVLLIDDQPAVRFGLRMLVQLELEYLTICEASSSAEALLMASHIRPDLVITDVELPDRDGITMTRQLVSVWPDCIVIVLTIHAQPSIRSQALAAGAWAFVEKGRPEDLRAAIRRALCHLRAR
jgi:DNA-binding NarL/FixJ family response regulator